MSRHFDTLGLEPDATTAEIRAAYKKLALKWHPDKNDAFNARLKFQEICEAYMALSNEEEDNNVELDDFYEGDGLGFGRGPDDVLFAAMFAEMRAHGFRAFGRGCTGGHPEHFNMNPYDDPLLHHHHSCPHHHLHHHTLAATKPFNGRHTHTHINGYSGIHTQHGHHTHVDEEDEDDTTPSDPVVPTLAPPTCSPADDHIHVTWCAPTLPSSTTVLPISLYYLEMKITKTYQLVYEGSAIQYTVPNLLPGTKYTFRLSATAGGTYAHLGKLKFTSAVPCTTTGVRDTQSKQAHPPVLSNLQLEAKDKKDRARDKKKKQQERSEARKAAEEEAAKLAAEVAKKHQTKKGGAISNGTTLISTPTSTTISISSTAAAASASISTPSSETSSAPTSTTASSSSSSSSSISLTTTPSTPPLTAKQIKAQNEEEKRQKKLQEEMEYQKFILQRRKELELEALAAEQRELEAFQAAKKAASVKEAEAAAQAAQLAKQAAAQATAQAQADKNKPRGSPAAVTTSSTPSKLGQSASQPNLPSPSSAASTSTTGSSSSRVPSSQGSPSLRGTPPTKNPRSVSKTSTLTLTSSPIQTPARGMTQSPSTSLSGLSTPTSTSSTLSDDGSADADDDVGGMNKPLSRSQRRRRKKKTEAAENGSPPATAATITTTSTSTSTSTSSTSSTSSHVVTPIASPAADKSPALRAAKPQQTPTQGTQIKNLPPVKSLTTPATTTTTSTATTTTTTAPTTTAPVANTSGTQPFSYAARVAGLSASNSTSALPTPSMTPISMSPPSLSPSTSTSNMPLPLTATPTAAAATTTTTTSSTSTTTSSITGPISFSAIVANKHRSSMTAASTSVTPVTSTLSALSMSSSQPLLPMPSSFSTPVSTSTSTSTLPTPSTTRHSLSASASPTITSRHTTLPDEPINVDTMLRAFEQAKRLYQDTISIRTTEYDGWNQQQDVGIGDANEMGYSRFGYNNNTTTAATTAPLSPSFPSFHPFQIRSAGVIDDERHAHLTPSSSSSSLLDPVFDPVHTLGRASSGSHSGVSSAQHTPSQHHLNVAGSGSSPRPIYDPSASSTTSSSASSSATATPSYRGFHSAFGSSPFLPIGSGSPASSHSSLSKSSSSFSLPSTSFSPYIHSSVASNSPSSSSRHTSMTDDTYEHTRHDHDHGVDDDVDLISLTKHVMLDDMEDQHNMEKEWNHTDVDASTSMYHNYAGFGIGAPSAFSTYGQTYGHTGFSLQSSYDLPPYDTTFDDYGTLPDDPQLAAVADVLDNSDS